jgi:hypothetical protein
MRKIFATPKLTRKRIWLAFAVAIATDICQLVLGPFGWAFIDEGLDVVAMILTSWLLGFHMLLLPTFVLEIIPLADWLPTWTGCVALLVSIRRKEASKQLKASETSQAT